MPHRVFVIRLVQWSSDFLCSKYWVNSSYSYSAGSRAAYCASCPLRLPVSFGPLLARRDGLCVYIYIHMYVYLVLPLFCLFVCLSLFWDCNFWQQFSWRWQKPYAVNWDGWNPTGRQTDRQIDRHRDWQTVRQPTRRKEWNCARRQLSQ